MALYSFTEDSEGVFYGKEHPKAVWTAEPSQVVELRSGSPDGESGVKPFIIAVIAHDLSPGPLVKPVNSAVILEMFIYRVYAHDSTEAEKIVLASDAIQSYLQDPDIAEAHEEEGHTLESVYDLDCWNALYVYVVEDPRPL